MDDRRWKVVPHPKLKRDFIDCTVRTRRVVRNAYTELPMGSIARIANRSRTGAELVREPCPHCGVGVAIGGVDDRAFEFVVPAETDLVEIAKPATVVAALRHAIVTATNDDMSALGSEKRRRHVARIEAMQDAVDCIEHWKPRERDA